MTATQPIAVLRGADPRSVEALLARCARREAAVTETAAPAPTRIVFGTDGWRARVADEFTFENVRRCADGVAPLRGGARGPGEGRGHRVRPAVRLGALRAGRGRGAARPRHPRRDQPDRRPDPDELVRGRPARLGRGHRDHGLAQPVDRQRVQGQVADGRRGRGATCCRRSRPRSTPTPARRSSVRPLEDAEAAGLVEWFDPFEGYQRFVAPDARPRGARGPPTCPCSSSRCTARAPDGSRGCSPAAGSGSPRSTTSATRTSAASTPSRSGPTSTRRWR